MFRLDREKLGNPCDLCIHNRKNGGTFGSEIAAQMYCKFAVAHAESKFKGSDSQSILKQRWFEKDNFLTKTTCTHFELNIDKLEKVVMKKLGIGVSGGTVGLITADGNITLAYDPLWVVKNSVSAILKCENNLARKYVVSVNGVMSSINTLEYYKLSDERKCILASGIWFSAMTLLHGAMNSGETPEWLSDNNGDDLMAVILGFFGHPITQPGSDTGQLTHILNEAAAVSNRACTHSIIGIMKKH